MRDFLILCGACLALVTAPARASETPLIPAEVLDQMKSADVVILGEIHDNPEHHTRQAEAVAALNPSATVWEMLTERSASLVNAQAVSNPEKLSETVRAAEADWPSIAMYTPIFSAAPQAPIYGALVPRKALRAALKTGAAATLGADAARYGLNVPLPLEEQAERELDQQAAHCGALPENMLANFVQMQRLRDAVLTRAILNAVEETGGPIVVITGNGHARKDRAVPRFLARMKPGLRVFSLGQSEDGRIEGTFDEVLDSPAVERDDPCAAFANQN